MPQTRKAFGRRRQVRTEAAKRSGRTTLQRTSRKQKIRQVGRRRGGR